MRDEENYQDLSRRHRALQKSMAKLEMYAAMMFLLLVFLVGVPIYEWVGHLTH